MAVLSLLSLIVSGNATILEAHFQDRSRDLRDNLFLSLRRVSRGDFDLELGQPPPIESSLIIYFSFLAENLLVF